MSSDDDFIARLSLSRHDGAAILFASLLSLMCLAKGGVYDTLIAIGLLLLPVALWLAASETRSIHQPLKRMGIVIISVLSVVLMLQQLVPSGANGLWAGVQSITGQAVSDTALYDKAAWMQGIGRLLFFVLVFSTALFIGASESAARMFFQALLVSGVICVAFTFFAATGSGVPTTTFYSYRHGFVNPNNAAAYLGIMLLVTFAQSARFFRSPATSIYKTVVTLIDQLTFKAVVKGCFLLFAILLMLAGLFLTGSRGGILMTMLCSIVFFTLIAVKTSLRARMRNTIIVCTAILATILFIWSFTNFGRVIANKLDTNGTSSNSRFDIFDAVMPMIGDHPLLGTGLGSFPGAFQQYRPIEVSSDGIIDKAHNSYLEFTAEMGIPAFAALMVALGWMGYALYQGFRERKERYVIPALGVVVWLFAAFYSLIDFPLQIPGIAALCIAITTICLSQTDRRYSEPVHKASSTTPKKRVRIRKRRGNTKPI